MKKVKVPDVVNYVPAFLTLECGLGCSYCINDVDGVVRDREELTTDQWIDSLNRLELKGDLPVTIQGGEPTKYKGFYDIINNINHPIDILTNLSFDIDEFIDKVDHKKLNRGRKEWYKPIRVSYHSWKMQPKQTINNMVKLQDAGFNVGLFALNLPELTEANMEMVELARKNQIYFFVKDFLGRRGNQLYGFYTYPEALDGKKKDAVCKTKDLLIAPDGDIFRCHRDLYHKENRLYNITDKDLKLEYKFRPCTNYGTCNPCDVKNKTNRLLQQGFCTVEIITPERKKIKDTLDEFLKEDMNEL